MQTKEMPSLNGSISFAAKKEQLQNWTVLFGKIHAFQCLLVLGDAEQELGPPPSVDEAANTLMTRLGFLLGEKVTEVMEVQDENQVSCLLSIL